MQISFCKKKKQKNTEQLIKYSEDLKPFHKTCTEIVVKLHMLAVDLKGK